jgi:hypothetical protein
MGSVAQGAVVVTSLTGHQTDDALLDAERSLPPQATASMSKPRSARGWRPVVGGCLGA